MKRAKVFLALPTYDGTLSAGTMTTVFQAMCGKSLDCPGFHWKSTSALCYNYNQLWCDFLNANRQGAGYTHFAMLHSDLQCAGHPTEGEESWLEWMVRTMQERGLECLSVANAIKDRQGRLSLAKGFGEWEQESVYFDDLRDLPETCDDVAFLNATGKVLLVNTGMMVVEYCDWAETFEFTFRDKIVREPNGLLKAVMAPEDWNMSRWFHARNIGYGFTTEVKTHHQGTTSFTNWDDGSGFYTHGWLDYDERCHTPEVWKLLADKFNVKTMLDVGCGAGCCVDWGSGAGIASTGVDFDKRLDGFWKAKTGVFALHDYQKGPRPEGEVYDMVCSTEFVEHVYDRHASNFLKDFDKAAKVLCMTHALPGQGGMHHVNERPPDHWIARVEAETGLKFDQALTDKCRDACPDGKFFKQSGLVFVRRKKCRSR